MGRVGSESAVSCCMIQEIFLEAECGCLQELCKAIILYKCEAWCLKDDNIDML